jgi:hypothetical protein
MCAPQGMHAPSRPPSLDRSPESLTATVFTALADHITSPESLNIQSSPIPATPTFQWATMHPDLNVDVTRPNSAHPFTVPFLV